mgnify:CR=1 FL=1
MVGNPNTTQTPPRFSEQSGRREVSFQEFVIILSSQALIQMGNVPNPLTNKTEINLAAAQHTIEILAMLEKKTSGNLTSEEQQTLEDVLYNLRLRYVDAVRSQDAKKKS